MKNWILSTALSIFTLALGFGLSPEQAQGSTVAIVDSGTDFEHVDIAGHQWTNVNEKLGNRIDDDRNGKVDDNNGWNFVDGYHRVFFREHLRDVDPIAYQLIAIIARKQAKTPAPGDEEYWKEQVDSLLGDDKNTLLAHLNFFGGYAHGTHVAGIVVSQAPGAKLLSARIFPDDVAPALGERPKKPSSGAGVAMFGLLDRVYQLLAIVTNGVFGIVSEYLHQSKADVANYSVGVSMKMLAENFLKIKGKSNPTPEELQAESQRIYSQYEPVGRKWIESATETLFVIAAGNDGSDNDVLPTFPANLRLNNSITVAATHGSKSLAEFSNFGATTVDIAAPGVAIESSVPSLDRQTRLPMSGTSMAAPYVTGVAAHVKDLNPALKATEIRELLMKTVDKKSWLEGKVVSAGLINPARAYAAAELSRSQSLAEAVTASFETVPVVIEEPVVVPPVASAPESAPQAPAETQPGAETPPPGEAFVRTRRGSLDEFASKLLF